MRDCAIGIDGRHRSSQQGLGVMASIALLVLAGCSPWARSPSSVTLFKPPRMCPDTVVLEMALVDIPVSERDSAQELWRSIDEQMLPIEVRRELMEEHIRCGVIGAVLPEWLMQQLELQESGMGLEPENGTVVVGENLSQRRIQCGSGQQRSVPLGGKRSELLIGSGTVSASETPDRYTDAQCCLRLTAKPLGDGRVQLELVPELHHGPVRQRWVGDEGFFRMDASQDVRCFEPLAMTLSLMPGQTLVMGGVADSAAEPESSNDASEFPGATDHPFGQPQIGSLPLPEATVRYPHLGATMFPQRKKFGVAGRLLLLRLAQTQQDDLFAPQQTITPIATLQQ